MNDHHHHHNIELCIDYVLFACADDIRHFEYRWHMVPLNNLKMILKSPPFNAVFPKGCCYCCLRKRLSSHCGRCHCSLWQITRSRSSLCDRHGWTWWKDCANSSFFGCKVETVPLHFGCHTFWTRWCTYILRLSVPCASLCQVDLVCPRLAKTRLLKSLLTELHRNFRILSQKHGVSTGELPRFYRDLRVGWQDHEKFLWQRQTSHGKIRLCTSECSTRRGFGFDICRRIYGICWRCSRIILPELLHHNIRSGHGMHMDWYQECEKKNFQILCPLPQPSKKIRSLKLTSPLKIGLPNRTVHLPTTHFQWQFVSFREGNRTHGNKIAIMSFDSWGSEPTGENLPLQEIVHEMWQRCLDNGDIYKMLGFELVCWWGHRRSHVFWMFFLNNYVCFESTSGNGTQGKTTQVTIALAVKPIWMMMRWTKGTFAKYTKKNAFCAAKRTTSSGSPSTGVQFAST